MRSSRLSVLEAPFLTRTARLSLTLTLTLASTSSTISTATSSRLLMTTTIRVVLLSVWQIALTAICSRLSWLLSLALSDLSRLCCRHGTRNVLGAVVDVETLLYGCWNWLDFRPELLLNLVHIEPIIPVDEVDSETKMSEAARSTNTMEISLGILGEIEVDDHIHCLNIDTTGKKIRAD